MTLYHSITILILVSDTLRKLNLISMRRSAYCTSSNTAEFSTKHCSIHIKNFNLISYWFVTYLKRISWRQKECSIFQLVSSRCYNEVAASLIAIC